MKFIMSSVKRNRPGQGASIVNLDKVTTIETVLAHSTAIDGDYEVRANFGIDYWHVLYRGSLDDCDLYIRDLYSQF